MRSKLVTFDPNIDPNFNFVPSFFHVILYMSKKECPPDKERYPLDTGNCLKKCK